MVAQDNDSDSGGPLLLGFPKRKPTPDSPTTGPATEATTPATPAEPTEPPAPIEMPEELRPTGAAGASTTTHRRQGPDYVPIPDRWRVGQPARELPGEKEGWILDPYSQNFLKGDYPILNDDKFVVLSVTSDTLFEGRRLPVPSGVSTAKPGSLDFFGGGRQGFITENLILSLELFKGDASYRPKDWSIKATPVLNFNYLDVQEDSIVNPNPEKGTTRTDAFIGFQELFYEQRLATLDRNFDFISVRAGIQEFNSDFRGFLFLDSEPGIRLFGNWDNNRIQYNLAWFHQLEKDTNSGLNRFKLRDQNVFIANVYHQDFLFPGYTAQLSAQANIDDSGGLQLDDNGVIVRPAPIGTIHDKSVRAYYLGWAGDGHIGRINITHQFYQVFGEETFNPIAGRRTDINAQFFAIEASYDADWLRYRASFLYASGDRNPFDGKANGFDSIFDDPNFAGGAFSFFTRQALRLTGSGVNLVNRNSFLPDLRTSKEEGQSNFVNPGLLLYNVGVDADITPKLRAIANVSYLQFANTNVIKVLLHDNKISSDLGIDCSLTFLYRPLLNNNIVITAGGAALIPGKGFRDIYTSEIPYSFFLSLTLRY